MTIRQRRLCGGAGSGRFRSFVLLATLLSRPRHSLVQFIRKLCCSGTESVASYSYRAGNTTWVIVAVTMPDFFDLEDESTTLPDPLVVPVEVDVTRPDHRTVMVAPVTGPFAILNHDRLLDGGSAL